MRSALVSAAMLGVAQVMVPIAAAAPLAPASLPASPDGEGADDGRGAVLARLGAAPFLAPPGAEQSPLVAIGEGKRGRGWRRRDDAEFDEEYAVPYFQYPVQPYAYYWTWTPPAPRYPYPPPPRYGWAPEPEPPRHHDAPPPPSPRPPPASRWIEPGS